MVLTCWRASFLQARSIQQSIVSSTVPCQLKHACILPTPKTATPQQNADYRPISITPVLSRLLERVTVLGPILFLLYVAHLLKLIKRHQLVPHAYADDIQIYGFYRPSSVNCLADRVSACNEEVSSWMRSNRLQVNPLKTEVLWCSSSRRHHQIPTSPVRIGSTYVLPFVISGST